MKYSSIPWKIQILLQAVWISKDWFQRKWFCSNARSCMELKNEHIEVVIDKVLFGKIFRLIERDVWDGSSWATTVMFDIEAVTKFISTSQQIIFIIASNKIHFRIIFKFIVKNAPCRYQEPGPKIISLSSLTAKDIEAVLKFILS